MLKLSSLFASLFFLLSSGIVSAKGSHAEEPQEAAHPSNTSVSGRWIITVDVYGTPLFYQMHLKEEAGKLTGDFGGDKLEGTVTGNSIHFVAKDEQGGTEECAATLKEGTMSGTFVFTDAGDPTRPETHAFTAALAPERRTGPARRHEFVPTTFYRQFSSANKPVLTISPGDTVHTTTVDAGGTDEKGVTRVLGGNPETGPFYVETAMPGDTLVVHLTRVRLNRDWAISDDGIVPRGLDTGLAVKMKDGGKSVRWHLDTALGVATPGKPSEHLAHYSVPLRPMLGCVATAPPPAAAPPGTGDSGGYGGNMDFNEVAEGATIYLPVRTPGALLYLGDGHAAQGVVRREGVQGASAAVEQLSPVAVRVGLQGAIGLLERQELAQRVVAESGDPVSLGCTSPQAACVVGEHHRIEAGGLSHQESPLPIYAAAGSVALGRCAGERTGSAIERT